MIDVWKVRCRYTVEETVWVQAGSNLEARETARGRDGGEILATSYPEPIGEVTIPKAEPTLDVPDWVKDQNVELFYPKGMAP